jgi:hypothetical protein
LCVFIVLKNWFPLSSTLLYIIILFACCSVVINGCASVSGTYRVFFSNFCHNNGLAWVTIVTINLKRVTNKAKTRYATLTLCKQREIFDVSMTIVRDSINNITILFIH